MTAAATIPASWTRRRLAALTAAGIDAPDIGDATRVTPATHDTVARLWSLHVNGVDLDAPGYPHGATAGYVRGCRLRDGCLQAVRRRQIAADLWRQHLPSAPDPAALAEHLRRLLTDPRVATPEDIAAAAGTAPRSVRAGAAGQRLRLPTAHALAAVTVEQARAVTARRPHALVDAALTRQRVGSMQWLGWPVKWQARRIGCSEPTLYAVLRGAHTRIEVRFHAAADQLATAVGDRPGPDPAATAKAQAAGWGPPAAYDDDGRPVPGAISASAGPGRRLDGLRLLLDGAAVADILREAAPGAAPTDRRVYTIASAVGLVVHVRAGHVTIGPGQDERIVLVRAHLANLAAGDPADQVWRELKAAAADAATAADAVALDGAAAA